ncbi:MAG TPA: glycosyltransferase family 2 protein [Gemmatimonadaceae bacterium]
MKLVMTLLVRDEEDILRENLEFHLARGVDEIILMDNLSVDRSASIAEEYARAGVLQYMFQPRDDYSQGRWVTQMARRAVDELDADWVINSDADEFWCPDAGSIKDALASVGPDAVAASVERTNFVTRLENGEPFWRRMGVRRTVSVNSLGEPLTSKTAHRGATDVVVGQGNHHVSVGGRLASCVPVPITILHFPVRSRAQFFNKIVKGGAAYARNTELDHTIGKTWRHLYQLYQEDKLDQAFERELMTDEQIVHGLAAGVLIRDERLISALTSRTHRSSLAVASSAGC